MNPEKSAIDFELTYQKTINVQQKKTIDRAGFNSKLSYQKS